MSKPAVSSPVLKVPDQIEIYWGGKWYGFKTVEDARAAGFDLNAPKVSESK